jgi:hypothetical protein
MLDELFQAYASEHLQTDSTEDPNPIFVGKDPVTGSVAAIFFAEECYLSQDTDVVLETHYIRNPSTASPGEFIISILPYIRELDETERELVTAQETVVDGVFCFCRYNSIISATTHGDYLSGKSWLDAHFGLAIEPVSSDSFRLGILCSTEKLTHSVFFAVKSVVLL